MFTQCDPPVRSSGLNPTDGQSLHIQEDVEGVMEKLHMNEIRELIYRFRQGEGTPYDIPHPANV